MSLLVPASRAGKLQDGNTAHLLQQYSRTLSCLVPRNLKDLSFGAIQFSFATNTEVLEAKLSASSGSCTVLQAEN